MIRTVYKPSPGVPPGQQIAAGGKWVATCPRVSPEQFGAVGDGIADDTQALVAALKYPVALSRATYRVTENILTSTLNVIGAGLAESRILLENGARIIYIGGVVSEWAAPCMRLADLAMVVKGENTGAVLVASQTFTAGQTPFSTMIERVDIIGAGHEDRFAVGMSLTDMGQSVLRDVRIRSSAVKWGESGIILNGANQATLYRLDNVQAYWLGTAVTASGNMEGLTMGSCTIVNCDVGVSWGGNLGMVISDCHINTKSGGVWMLNPVQTTIANCLFYGYGNADYTGVKYQFDKQGGGSAMNNLHNCQILCQEIGGKRIGVDVAGKWSDYYASVRIKNNEFQNFDVAGIRHDGDQIDESGNTFCSSAGVVKVGSFEL